MTNQQIQNLMYIAASHGDMKHYEKLRKMLK